MKRIPATATGAPPGPRRIVRRAPFIVEGPLSSKRVHVRARVCPLQCCAHRDGDDAPTTITTTNTTYYNTSYNRLNIRLRIHRVRRVINAAAYDDIEAALNTQQFNINISIFNTKFVIFLIIFLFRILNETKRKRFRCFKYKNYNIISKKIP